MHGINSLPRASAWTAPSREKRYGRPHWRRKTWNRAPNKFNRGKRREVDYPLQHHPSKVNWT